jgi:hypothetical protein
MTAVLIGPANLLLSGEERIQTSREEDVKKLVLADYPKR